MTPKSGFGPRRGISRRPWALETALITAGTLFTAGLSPAVSRAALANSDIASGASCSVADGFNEATASPALLKRCGIVRVGISGSTPMAGGGRMYEYKDPYGQTIYVPTTPAGGVLTANLTNREKIDYGISIGGEQLNAHGILAKVRIPARWVTTTHPPKYMYGNLNAAAEMSTVKNASSQSPTKTYKNVPWAGYGNTATGWKQAIAQYTEPSAGMSSCLTDHDGVVFWSGIGGVTSKNMGQIGTAIHFNGWANGAVWFETDPDPRTSPPYLYRNKPVAKPGAFVTVQTSWDGSKYMFTLWINGKKYPPVGKSGTWAAKDSSAEEIVEPIGSGKYLPDFDEIDITGLNGRDPTYLWQNPLIKFEDPSKLSTSSIDYFGRFSVYTNGGCN